MSSGDVSSKKLQGNAKAAMISAIEIYNKPFFLYREECVVILLTNAWELLLKGVLNERGEEIYYPKEGEEEARTLSLAGVIKRVKNKVPQKNFPSAWDENIRIIKGYRDKATHYYSQKDMPATLYPLFQASIKNFRDIMDNVFSEKLEDDINWKVLPLGINTPINIVSYLSNNARSGNEIGKEILDTMKVLQSEDRDTEGLVSLFEVRFVSSKNADFTVAIDGENRSDARVITKKVDPNMTHQLFTKDVVERVRKKRQFTKEFTSYTFQAIKWRHEIHENLRYCWKLSGTGTRKYSHDMVKFIEDLSEQNIEECLKNYREYLRAKQKSKKK